MSEIRDRISKDTGIYFKDTPISKTFVELQKGGIFDQKTMIKIMGTICDYLEERETKPLEKEPMDEVLVEEEEIIETPVKAKAKKDKKK